MQNIPRHIYVLLDAHTSYVIFIFHVILDAMQFFGYIAGGEWIGHYNQSTKQYISINGSNLDHSLRVVQILVDLHKADPVVVGLEPCKCVFASICTVAGDDDRRAFIYNLLIITPSIVTLSSNSEK